MIQWYIVWVLPAQIVYGQYIIVICCGGGGAGNPPPLSYPPARRRLERDQCDLEISVIATSYLKECHVHSQLKVFEKTSTHSFLEYSQLLAISITFTNNNFFVLSTSFLDTVVKNFRFISFYQKISSKKRSSFQNIS